MASLTQPTGPAHTRILSIGAARGDIDVPNDDIVGPIDSSDEWIRQRTGIVQRRRASSDIGAVDLAVAAGEEAIVKSGLDRSEIDGVIISTISNVAVTPSMAALAAHRLGLTPAAAFDISAACAGYVYAVGQADALVRAGNCKNVLVIGAEKLSDVIDPTDRSISFLLADGAGAVVVGASDHTGIGPTIWGSDGERWDTIRMTSTFAEYRANPTEVAWPTLRQDGQTVFRWAVWEMAKVARRTLEESGIKPEELAAFIPHQANMRIIDELAKQLKLPESVVIARDIEMQGNTSAASIPLAMHALREEHPELSGGLALTIGFGAGLVFGAQIVEIP
ncbi:3-oxoacyl-[acyl-carrier-protein] synthase-3 [Leucobacter exalbidus]|uniref:Beta-ketoacyl-[acyl-carrier-protein] synthase III n=1 Tax=Leucobacter exalbidus TaxID=662960 RepID=A0A940SZR1_9MICO|nr:beta-ketoacyl-ACP synthase III [Leucobacter exalbidus]MBP1325155.1 3-oxoacyl-[acyl-carrier-protein] synthase-3 [Leucobacter exalbidus]